MVTLGEMPPLALACMPVVRTFLAKVCTSLHTGMCTVMTRIMMITDKAGMVMASMYNKSEAERQGNGGALMT